MSWGNEDYVALDDLKRHLRVPGNYDGTINTEEDTTDDIPLGMAITASSRLIDQAAARQFSTVDDATTFYYTPEWDDDLQRYIVHIDDLMTSTDLVLSYRLEPSATYDYTTTAFTLEPRNAAAKGRPWTLIVFDQGQRVSTKSNSVAIEAIWGWTEVPTTIKQATLIQAARIFKRRDAVFGVVGSADMGSGDLRLLAKLDPDVQTVIVPFTKKWGSG